MTFVQWLVMPENIIFVAVIFVNMFFSTLGVVSLIDKIFNRHKDRSNKWKG